MFLDIACGTGDLSINACLKHRHIKAFGVDFVFPMVKVGKDKVKKKGLSGQLNFMQGNALRLPFQDNSFDVTGIAFGIRNIPDRIEALWEMLRVTVPGGQIMILEMTFIENRFFKLFYYIYLNYLLPLIAKGVFQKYRRVLLPCRFNYELSITGCLRQNHARDRYVRSKKYILSLSVLPVCMLERSRKKLI